MSQEERHPEIRIDKIPIKGIVGGLFVVGGLSILLVGIPSLRWVFPVSVGGGLVAGTLLILWRKYR